MLLDLLGKKNMSLHIGIFMNDFMKHDMADIFKTGFKYLRQPSLSLGVMTKDKTKIRLRSFVNCYRTKTNVITSFCPKL